MNTPIKDLIATMRCDPLEVRCVPAEDTPRYLAPGFKPDPALRYRWFADRDGSQLKDQPLRLYCEAFRVTRSTDKSEWVSVHGVEHRQLKYAVKKFAHTHPGAALHSFIRRRGRWHAQLESQLRYATAITDAANALAKTTDLTPWRLHPDVGVDYPAPDYPDNEGGW